MKVQTFADQLYFVTARIEAVQAGRVASSGTGFFYSVEAETIGNPNDSGTAVFLVTNKHVVEGADSLLIHLIRAADDRTGPILGSRVTAQVVNPLDAWTPHPEASVDIAVRPFVETLNLLAAQGDAAFIRAISASQTLTSEVAADLDSIEDVVFFGYPNALYDRTNLTPIARTGMTATPIMLNYEGQPAFLVDASVFPGSSGSPVFLRDTGTWRSRDGAVNVGTRRLYLLGVVAAVHVREIEADLQELPTKYGVTLQDPLNLGIVYKASAIDECVNVVLERSGKRRRSAAVVDPTRSEGQSAA